MTPLRRQEQLFQPQSASTVKGTIDENSATNMTESQNVQVPPALSESNSDLFHHSYEERGTKLDNNIFG